MAQFTLLILITLYLLGSVIGEPQIVPQLFLNRLNISYGINYKYNGQLNHNIDRVWVVTKIKTPSFEDIKFPNISFNPECKFLERLKDGKNNTNSQILSVRQICRDSAPLVKLFQYKEDYKEAKGVHIHMRYLSLYSPMCTTLLIKWEEIWTQRQHFHFHKQYSILTSYKDKKRFCCFCSCFDRPSHYSSGKYWIFPSKKAQCSSSKGH